MDSQPTLEVCFLTAEQRAFVSQVRDTFKDEFAKRQAEGRLHPCFFGDVALLRIFHMCGGNADMGKFWFWNFLQKAEEHKLDELVFEVKYKMEEANLSLGEVDILPHHEEVNQYYRMVHRAPKLSPDGDVIVYSALLDVDKLGIMAALDWDHYVKYQRALTVMRCMDLDKLSRDQGRLVMIIWIWDLYGCSMEHLLNATFNRPAEADIGKFAESITCETVGKFRFVNASWTTAALYNMLKMFLPESLIRKTAFVSGDGLEDADFVNMVGGGDQLRQLYATRAGLAKDHKHSTTEMLDCMPTDAERGLIAKLRTKFKGEFDKREKEGRAHPCFFGDIALARVLRGNDGLLGPAVQWFKRFLAMMAELNVDEVVEELTKKMDESQSLFGCISMLPHYDELKDYSRMIFSAPRLTPAGDVVAYIPLGDHHRAALIANSKFEQYVRCMLGVVVLRCVEVDRLSRIQNRMVRFVTVLDLEGTGSGIMGLPAVPEYDIRHKAELEPLMTSLYIDVLRATHVVNAPWLAVKAYNIFTALVPEKLSKKMRMIAGDGFSDPDFVKAIGGEAQLHQFFGSRAGLVAGGADRPSGTQEIAAGGVFRRALDVRSGQTVHWSFQIQAGSADDWLGSSDLEFSVTACWHPEYRKLPHAAPPDSRGGATAEAAEELEEGSLDFDGAGGFVEVTEVPSFEAFTWSAWVKPTGENWCSEHTLIHRADQITLSASSGNLTLWLHDGSWNSAVQASWDRAFADRWHHLAAAYDGKAAKIFINGVLLQSAAVSIKLTETTNRILLGAGLDYADRYFFSGQLTEVCLHSAARSAEQIQASMHTRLDPRSEADLAGYVQLRNGVSFEQRRGVLMQGNVGRAAALSYWGGKTSACSASPFGSFVKSARQGQEPANMKLEAMDSDPRLIAVIAPGLMVPGGRNIEGTCEAIRNGVITLKWSNAHSRMRAKSLEYKVEVRAAADVADAVEVRSAAAVADAVEVRSAAAVADAVEVRSAAAVADDFAADVADDFADCDEGAESAAEFLEEELARETLRERVTEKLRNTAPEVLAASAMAEVAKCFEANQDFVYRLDE